MTTDSEERLVKRYLIPVQVFGGGLDEPRWGYGLSDAIEPWSDCNRAAGHIFRLRDQEWDERGIPIMVAEKDLPALEALYDEDNVREDLVYRIVERPE